MVAIQPPERREELGAFVRALREKLVPGALGLAAGSRRRTPGLRREEVAQLAGLSVTWYTWLEQGRAIALSPAALGRLAVALRLGRAERVYLFDLAGQRDAAAGEALDEAVPTGVLAAIETIAAPAYLLDRLWTARGWNAPAARLFTGWLDDAVQPGEDTPGAPAPSPRNLLRFIFLDPRARRLIADWETRARRVVAEFRADVSGELGRPEIRHLVDTLAGSSAAFARFWDEHTVLEREGGERRFHHPEDGALAFRQVTFAVASRPDFKLTILLAASVPGCP